MPRIKKSWNNNELKHSINTQLLYKRYPPPKRRVWIKFLLLGNKTGIDCIRYGRTTQIKWKQLYFPFLFIIVGWGATPYIFFQSISFLKIEWDIKWWVIYCVFHYHIYPFSSILNICLRKCQMIGMSKDKTCNSLHSISLVVMLHDTIRYTSIRRPHVRRELFYTRCISAFSYIFILLGVYIVCIPTQFIYIFEGILICICAQLLPFSVPFLSFY